MSDFIGLAASAAQGGVFGLIGTVIGRAAGSAERRQAPGAAVRPMGA